MFERMLLPNTGVVPLRSSFGGLGGRPLANLCALVSDAASTADIANSAAATNAIMSECMMMLPGEFGRSLAQFLYESIETMA